MNKQKNIEYKLAGFELTQFRPAWENYTDGVGVEIQNNIGFAYNAEKKVLKCTISMSFVQGINSVLDIEFCTYIELHPDSVKNMTEENRLVVPANFLAQCASFGHGAIRGVMYLKTQNTPLEGADRKSTRLNSSHIATSRMPSSA